MHASTLAGLLLSVTVMFGQSLSSDQAPRQKGAPPGKRETLTAEQKQRLTASIKSGAERRRAERPQLLARLKTSDLRFLASERQRVEKENASIRARASAFQAQTANARYSSIEREARELSRRSAKATPVERKAIERRAAELLAELRGRKPAR